MKAKSLLLLSVAAFACGCHHPAPTQRSLDQQATIRRLSDADKASLIVGTYMHRTGSDSNLYFTYRDQLPGAAGTTNALDSIGIPSIILADGPAGLHISATRPGDTHTYHCTHFPIATLLASTWDTNLIHRVGQAIGEETYAYGADILLAPAINIMRHPLCGRNFEYYSEDPLVAGLAAAAYIRGVQSCGVGTSVKHFAANNQETNRMKTDVRASQRALREIYLKGFEIAIRQGQPWTVMSSYNQINGTYTSESHDLLTAILRGEWGYDGAVITDWFGGSNSTRQVQAGTDLIMPGARHQYDTLLADLSSGRLSHEDLNRSVAHTLALIEKTPRFQGHQPTNAPHLTVHATLARQTAAEGMVLLKNSHALPLASTARRLALYGTTSYSLLAGGTGSGAVSTSHTTTLPEGLQNLGYALDTTLQATYQTYWTTYRASHSAPRSEYRLLSLPAEMSIDTISLATQAVRNDLALITLGRSAGETSDRPTADFNLSAAERQLLAQVCRAYHQQGKAVVVLLNIGAPIETASWQSLPDAILCCWQGGQEGGQSIAEVLAGKQSPSGKLTMTWPRTLADLASHRNFPLDLHTDEDIYDRTLDTTTRNVDYVLYEEDIYVGYRYTDAFAVPVAYPFGYGLSYTSFSYSDASIRTCADSIEVIVSVTNTGQLPGKEAVQLYAAAPDSKAANKPVKELKAFAKTHLLQPGESQTLRLTLATADLASFDEVSSSWVVAEGDYNFLIRATLTAHLAGQSRQAGRLLTPKYPLHLLHR